MPEARIPLSVVIIEMALSPKSNSAYTALAKAIEDIENGRSGPLPLHLKNLPSFSPDQTPYKYPHDYPNAWVNQQYLPDNLVGRKYYVPKDSSKIETSLKERYLYLEKLKQNS